MATDKRHPVAQGGMWNTSKPQYSKETQNLLEAARIPRGRRPSGIRAAGEMMKESKLTNFQQRQLKQAMTDGKTLPTKCNPTSSAKARVQAPPTKPGSAVIDPRTYNPAVRTQEMIEASGAYARETYQPSPQTKFGGFYEKDKDRLANIMAYGEDLPPPGAQKPARPRRREDVQPDIDRFDELQNEMADRQKFLDEMESHGLGDKYRTIIKTEMSQLLREMEIIDRKRTADLEKAIAAQEKSKQTGIPNATMS